MKSSVIHKLLLTRSKTECIGQLTVQSPLPASTSNLNTVKWVFYWHNYLVIFKTLKTSKVPVCFFTISLSVIAKGWAQSRRRQWGDGAMNSGMSTN